MFGPRILVDVRETETIRGYHALAAAEHIARNNRAIRWYFLTSDHPEERLAVTSTSFDLGIRFRDWRGAFAPKSFHLYLIVADVLPDDPATEKALGSARLVLAGLTFSKESPDRQGLVTASGHDTVALAAKATELLRGRRAAKVTEALAP